MRESFHIVTEYFPDDRHDNVVKIKRNVQLITTFSPDYRVSRGQAGSFLTLSAAVFLASFTLLLIRGFTLGYNKTVSLLQQAEMTHKIVLDYPHYYTSCTPTTIIYNIG